MHTLATDHSKALVRLRIGLTSLRKSQTLTTEMAIPTTHMYIIFILVSYYVEKYSAKVRDREELNQRFTSNNTA